jgi:Mg-chelatase subunit ChlD
MVLPKSTDVTLDVKDFLSEQEYDRKKAGIISRVVNSAISVEYQRDINCAFETEKGFKIIKAKPKLKGIDGNTAMNHELAHVLFNSFDPKALKTLRDWAFQWGAQGSPAYAKAFDIYHTAMNVIEDQRIESLWGRIYLGNFRDFQRVRKKLGKSLEFIDHPSAVLLAERFFRPDLVSPSKYAEVAPFIHDVEGKDLSATMIVMKRIKPFLDEKIKNGIDTVQEYNDASERYRKKAADVSDTSDEVERQNSIKLRDEEYRKIKDISKVMREDSTPTLTETRSNPRLGTVNEESMTDVEKYTDEELGTNNYEEALKSSEDEAHSRLQEIKQSMEGTDMVKAPTYIRDKPVQTHTKYKPNVDTKVVASLKRLLRTFKEKTHEDVSDEGYDLDIGEYINMKSNGYGDCFIEDKDTNGLSIVLSIDGSGSMGSHNKMVADMVQTIHESTKGEKEIEIKTIVWSSDRMGNVALQRFNTNDIQYIPYQRGGYTPTHFGISEGSKELAKMNGRRKLLILITDGFPNYHNNGVKVRTDATASATIKAYKKAMRTTPNIAVVGVGMMQTNTYMKNMFGNKYIACRSMNEVGQFMTTTLRREIVRVMKR